MNEKQLYEEIERYLNGEMSQQERNDFDALRRNNSEVERQFNEHRQFIGMLKHFGERRDLEERLNAIHDEIDVQSLKEEVAIHPSWIVQLWRQHHSKISVAASIAIFAMLSTLFVTGYFTDHSTNITQLRLQIKQQEQKTRQLDNRTAALMNDIRKGGKRIMEPAKFGGTGFAVSSNGYLVTNYHVIRDADSVYVQNQSGDSYHARVIYSDEKYDVALLKIDDSTFKSQSPLPYAFKRSESDLGEDVFTLGYPKDNVVVGRGYLSSATGAANDTISYQVSIPVNPGNSGGPVLDGRGNVIGMISAKQSSMEGAAFAIKSAYVLKAIQNIPADSVKKKISVNTKNTLATLSRPQQIKRIMNYVYQVKVY